ncbi:MAG: plastocyanin/azurin family copper-binding protein [Salinigranum sp.]
MNRRAFLGRLAGVGAVGGSAAVAAGTTARAAAAQSTTHEVGMYSKGGNEYFDPIGLYVQPGDTVKWVIKSGEHSTTSYTPGNPRYSGDRLVPDGAKPWNSQKISGSGTSYEHTFKTKGTYDYFCIPHKTLGMVGRIVCGQPGGPAEQKSIPQSDRPTGVMPPSDVIVEKKSVSWPYIPQTGHGGPPALFWGGLGVFSLTSIYLFSVYDRKSGRYDELPSDIGTEGDSETVEGK